MIESKKPPKFRMIETSSGILFYSVHEVREKGVIREVLKFEGVIV